MNQALQAAQQLVSFVDSLLVPIVDSTVLLPVSAISEVIDSAEPQPSDNQPDWGYGTIGWRDQQLSLLSYEALIGGEKPELTDELRFAIFKASDEDSDFGFYALAIQGYPRSVRITPTSDFRPQEEQPEKEGALMHANLDEQPVVIPDLAYIEKQLQQHWS